MERRIAYSQGCLVGWILWLLCGACNEPSLPEQVERRTEPDRQPRYDMVASLKDDLAAPRHPADGGGRAWLEIAESTVPATVSTAGRWVLSYEAGPLGVAEGGMIFLQVSPFWGWSTPQVTDRDAPGYTEVTTTAKDIELEPQTLDQQLLGIAVRGRALAVGERVRIVYGAGERGGAVADRFAERQSRFWIAVDGDGDGVRQVLADSPFVAVSPGPAARLLLTLPSTARPGETVRLTAAVLDPVGNAGVEMTGEIILEALGEGVEAPRRIVLELADRGRRTVELVVHEEGVVRLRGTGPGELVALSNPLQVAARGRRILWGDLQNHSARSDGTGTPEELFLYARDVAALDVVALTDHDRWGLLFLDQHPEIWQEIQATNERFHRSGRFVTLLGYEWTHWVHGHRHVLYFGDAGEVLSSLDPSHDSPQQLWEALRGRALTVAHHSAGGPIATDWSIAPDPELEPVTELVSVHGSSEAPDSPSPIYRPIAGNFVRDALDRGYRLGFIGSSDGHDGHPGLGHLASAQGGLAAILSEDLTREAIYEALRARRTYATSGPRMVLRVSFAGFMMGADVPVDATAREALRQADGGSADFPPDSLVVRVLAPSELDRVDVIRSGEEVGRFDCEDQLECTFALRVEALAAGEYLYVRAVQRDGGAAWSSPFFFR